MTGIARGLSLVVASAISLGMGPLQTRDAPSLASRAPRVDELLASRRAPFPFSGSVLIAIDGRMVLDKGYGAADLELGVPNTAATIFRIGSLTKPLTATAVMALVSAHRMSLDDSLCRYVKACPVDWSPVTIRDLLGHRSGIPDLFNEVAAVPVRDMRAAIDAAIEKASQRALDSRPGSTYVYRNFNYLLLGYAMEVAAGKPWEDVLRAQVFDVADMPRTAYDDVWSIVPGRARGYDIKDGVVRNIKYKDHGAFAAGGLLSSTHDLWAFAEAFFSRRLLSSSAVLDMLAPGPGDYGLGWQIKRYFGRPMVNHSGGIDGFASHLAVYPDERLVIVVLSNIDSEPAKSTACDIAAVLFDAGPPSGCPAS